MTARRATSADIPEIVRVANAAFRVEDFFIDGDRTNADDVAVQMARPHACFLVLDGESPTELAASVFVEIRGGRGYFAMLAVDPALQRNGLGRRLVEAVEQYCRAAGCDALDISVVNLRVELPAFYRRLGFSATSTAPLTTHALKQEAHFVLMSKPLVPV
jgi:ribosomal protein S18 acetylase RimI-like enzyme